MNEKEYATLTAPLDLTKQDDKRGKKRHRRGDKKRDNTKPLPAEITVEEDDTPKEADYQKMKKAELVILCEERGLSKTGKKDDLIARLVEADQPVLFDIPNDDEIISSIMSLKGVKLAQRTPERVSHRRADLIRRREVIEVHEPIIETMEDGSKEVELTLRCESGTYVKETIHGDSGRTQPCVASLLKAKCDVKWLDVGDIHAD